jgi:hypothetical protein
MAGPRHSSILREFDLLDEALGAGMALASALAGAIDTH